MTWLLGPLRRCSHFAVVCWASTTSEVESLVAEGLLAALVSDMEDIPSYWANFANDFPGHPVMQEHGRNLSSLGITLYCWMPRLELLALPRLPCRFAKAMKCRRWAGCGCFLLWTSGTSPFLTDSRASRFVIAAIPANLYVVRDDGVNATLAAATKAVVDSCNHLGTQGVRTCNLDNDPDPCLQAQALQSCSISSSDFSESKLRSQ